MWTYLEYKCCYNVHRKKWFNCKTHQLLVLYINDIMQKRCNSSVLPMESHLFHIKPLIYTQVQTDVLAPNGASWHLMVPSHQQAQCWSRLNISKKIFWPDFQNFAFINTDYIWITRQLWKTPLAQLAVFLAPTIRQWDMSRPADYNDWRVFFQGAIALSWLYIFL